MKARLSHPLNKQHLQSGAGYWRLTTGAILLGIMTGCATTPGSDDAKTASPEPDMAPVAEARLNVDHSPIAARATGDNSATKPDDRIADAPEEDDMTVLVLDNPELMAQAARIHASSAQVTAMNESPRKPHVMKFHFGFDKHRLSEQDQAILREHAAYLAAHPDVSVRINGHTDSFGPEEYNAFLSRLRANSAAKILKQEGIDESRIEVVGWGSQKPLTNPEDSAANRRLEIEYQSEQMAKAQ